MPILTIRVEHVFPEGEDVKSLLAAINQLKELIMSTQAELATELTAVKAQLDKAKQEIVDKLAALEAAIVAAGNTTAEVDAALADLKGAAQGLDDLNPDAPV